MSLLSDSVLLFIFRKFPPNDVIFKSTDSRSKSEYEDECKFPIFKWFDEGPEMFNGKDVLDLGSGFGGRTVRFLEYGAKSVTGVEVSEEQVFHSAQFAESKSANAQFYQGTGEKIPGGADQFDLIMMFDVMEHVISPQEVLTECWRVLRPGGRLAIVFPPYYDITAGSHLHGYATCFPGLNIVFTTKALRSAATKLLEKQGVEYWRFLRQDVPTDKLWNQNGLTVRAFRSMIKNSPFEVERFDCLGHMERRLSTHTGLGLALRLPFYAIPGMLANIPFIQEVACSRVCTILRKG